mmetsp:Transcript_3369/g.3690  ORF Transcript_3369/g.3690 Transcript_3369/m.3690 type:complete len:349 (-) Transcript_3369:188-1234(-)
MEAENSNPTYSLFDPPYLQRLKSANKIFLTGCGGGFDFLQGMPLYFALKKMGKDVALGNLAFTETDKIQAQTLLKLNIGENQMVCKISKDAIYKSSSKSPYFPEKHACEWLETNHFPGTMYVLRRTGVRSLLKSYEAIYQDFNFDMVILVDGGSDVLMAGDENELGSPAEDVSHLTAISHFQVADKVIDKLVICLGVSVDRYHGVSDKATMRAIAEITKSGGYLGGFPLVPQMEEVQKMLELSAHIEKKMPNNPSIVTNSVISAITGEFGNFHRCERTEGSALFINPLMSQYHFFDLQTVAKRLKYREWLEDTDNLMELVGAIQEYRKDLSKKKKILPVEEWPRTDYF